MIRRAREEFVPVALKAALVNRPPGGAEGRLYAGIGRSKPAPQGICVANASGEALAWALSFDDEESIAAFLDHARALFRARPEGGGAVERYMSFPGRRLADAPDAGAAPPLPEPSAPPRPAAAPGTLDARLVGRVVDGEGRPAGDPRRQDDYVEDRFDLPPALLAAPPPNELARAVAAHAYLGMLDVRGREVDQGWRFRGAKKG